MCGLHFIQVVIIIISVTVGNMVVLHVQDTTMVVGGGYGIMDPAQPKYPLVGIARMCFNFLNGGQGLMVINYITTANGIKGMPIRHTSICGLRIHIQVQTMGRHIIITVDRSW